MSAGEKHTVLIANPCDAERSLLGWALESHGFAALKANCAKEAIETARNQNIDLVLLDSLNWDNPSLAALTVLKHDAKTRHIPVVIFGQPQSKEQVTEALQKGAATWIGRQGFDLDSFSEKLSAVISKHVQSASNTNAHLNMPMPAAVANSVLQKLNQEVVNDLLTQIGRLPAFECNLVDVLTTASTKEGKISENVGSNLMRDPALALAVLSAANSKLNDKQQPVQDAAHAAEHLGAHEFYSLVESMPTFRVNLASLWDAGLFWAHSVATARLAAMLSRRLDLGSPASAEVAGLLHDLGRYILAVYYPAHYGALFTASTEAHSVHSMWEREIIGAHHGEIGAWAAKHYHLPPMLQDAILHHHAPEPAGQMMSASSRLLIMIVHAADGLANAMLPADPPLSLVDDVSLEFERTLADRSITPLHVIENARQIVADLLTEMTYLFPQSMTRSYFYRERPLDCVAYMAPQAGAFDLFKAAFEMRSREIIVLDRLTSSLLPAETSFVLNLTGMRETAAQMEVLSSLMSIRSLQNRRGIVLLPAQMPPRVAQNLLPSTWQFACLPVHLWKCIRWLNGTASNEPVRGNLCVA